MAAKTKTKETITDVGQAFDLDDDTGTDGGRTPEGWRKLRAAIDSGDDKRIEAARRGMDLSSDQAELAKLCVAEHNRLTGELAELQDAAEPLDNLRHRQRMLIRYKPQSIDQAGEYGDKLAEIEKAVQAAEKAAGLIVVVTNWAGGCVNTCPELFGVYGQDAAKLKRLGAFAPPSVRNWINEHIGDDWTGDWFDIDRRPTQEATKLYRLEALASR